MNVDYIRHAPLLVIGSLRTAYLEVLSLQRLCHVSHYPCISYYEINLPFILVPRGSPFLPIRAQALSSNLTTIPSFLCNFLAVRTTTACLISPLLTLFTAATELALLSPKPRAF